MRLAPEAVTERRRDVAALAVLLVVAVAATALTMADATRYIRGDWPSMFFPIYAYLGEQLRALDIPGWNPHQFAGAPFAGDPSSGWAYLPAMLFYTVFPAVTATTLFLGFHVVLSAVAAFVLARLSGLGPAGSLVAGTAYTLPWLVPGSAGLVLFFQIHAWLPVALIGIELALRPGLPSRRFAGIVLAGVAISQILAAWLGQSSYYALLVIGGWVAWRTLVTPPRGWTVRQRVGGLFGIGVSILLFGFALNAMALLVRLEANANSNIPGGDYTGASRWADTKTGSEWHEIAMSLAGGFSEAGWRYAGAAVLALALLAPFVAPRWPPLLFWFGVGAVAIALALAVQTPVHALFYALLPRFELIHSHLPGRVLLVIPLASSLLAGATADALARWQPAISWSRLVPLVPVAAVAAGAVWLERQGIVSAGSLAAALAALAVCAVAVALPIALRPLLVPLALAAIVIWDPVGRVVSAGWGPNAGPQRSLRAALAGDVEGFLHRNGAADFLAAATEDAPDRYAGYDPALLPLKAIVAGDLPPQGYRKDWLGPANWLLVLNWATWFGLDDAQGHNPLQPMRYVEYIDALNGHLQEYHDRNIFPAGIDSPLLDLLNLRYLVVPADAANRADLEFLASTLPTVYEDEHVRIVENPEALPRAWLVHEARQVAPGEALPLLADGTIDPRTTALLESPPPALAAPAGNGVESADYVVYEADRVVVAVNAGSAALLVLSEVWDPGWVATVDGEPAPVLLANHVFRGVPVAGGEHTVELRYDPASLRVGMVITIATVAVLMAVWATLVRRERLGSRAAAEILS